MGNDGAEVVRVVRRQFRVVHDCRVLDVSLSGASVATRVKPPLGNVVVLGRLRGSVVRYHDEGFAIQFAELQDPDSLAWTFG
jgi:hypothetical protein